MAVSQLETTPTAGRECTRARAPCVARAISCVDTRRTGDAQLTLSVRFRGRELRARRPFGSLRRAPSSLGTDG